MCLRTRDDMSWDMFGLPWAPRESPFVSMPGARCRELGGQCSRSIPQPLQSEMKNSVSLSFAETNVAR
jgi:hypothetical protein